MYNNIALLLVIFNFNLQSHSFPLIGTIKNDIGKILGTGFVVYNGKLVVTCNHVDYTHKGEKYYHPFGLERRYKLEPSHRSKNCDIIIYSSDSIITKTPNMVFKIDSVFDINAGDSVFYLGYDSRSSTLLYTNIKVHSAVINHVGEGSDTLRGFHCKGFNFYGEAIEGYSGGPVLNNAKKVIGILVLRDTINGKNLNTAFLVNELHVMLNKEY